MNEADTRRELIDPKLKESGWGEIENSKIRAAYKINNGEIKPGRIRASYDEADYVLIYKNRKLAVVEAKPDESPVSEGVTQAKEYAEKLKVLNTYSSNGNEIYEIQYSVNEVGQTFIKSEKLIEKFPSPDELWERTFIKRKEWSDKFDAINFKSYQDSTEPRYYQEIAINRALDAIANNKKRILLTLATGTGKTVIAFHIAWKIFQSKWNLKRDGKRAPRILFLADRNILANQAFNKFSGFGEKSLVRITPSDVRRTGKVPTSGAVFFTIFQSFMSGPEGSPYFGGYPKDFFDLIFIDECHRGGANDESSWRDILEYFSPAVQIGLTATPKRDANVDTYDYFGEPVYIYSLKEGIKDGFLTPFKVKRIQTTIDEYTYSEDDEVLSGEEEINPGETFTEQDINRRIIIPAREKKRVQLMLNNMNTKEKTIIFCANIAHAMMIRDFVNQLSVNPANDYCVSVTAADGEIGEQHLRYFQDTERLTPTILTTSSKLSTGVDASNIRNIVLMRLVNSMVEFKQIIGRGTRLNQDKYYFTIIDFVGASENFSDPDWDGEPPAPTIIDEDDTSPPIIDDERDDDDTVKIEDPPTTNQPIIIQLSEDRELAIQDMTTSTFFFNGQQISAEAFIQKLFNTITLPSVLKSEEELRKLWSSPITRKELLKRLNDYGFSLENLKSVQSLIDAEDSDIYDVLEYIAYNKQPIQRIERATKAEHTIGENLNENQKEFIEFVLSKYVEGGVEELDINKLSSLVELKYNSLHDAQGILGDAEMIKKTFIDFQKYLY